MPIGIRHKRHENIEITHKVIDSDLHDLGVRLMGAVCFPIRPQQKGGNRLSQLPPFVIMALF